MKPADIGRAYDKITHLWESDGADRDGFDRHNGIAQHERALAFVEKGGLALDVGCGCTGRFIELLQQKGFSPEGIDVSEAMINLAKERHPDITFYNDDICEWLLPKKYDFISAWDSIWHVPLTQQEAVLTKLIASLNTNGVLIFSCGGTEQKGEHKDNAMGPDVYYSTLGVNGFLALLMRLDCTCRHFEYDQYPELHSYFIVQKS